MSYHLNMEKRKDVAIEMPPLPAEPVVAAPEVPDEPEQEVETQQEEVVQVQVAQDVQPAPQETAGQSSFRQLRQKTSQLERERDEALRKIREYEEAQQSFKPQQQTQPSEEDFTLGDDDLMEGKHAKKLNKKIDSKYEKLARDFEEYKQQNASVTAEQRLMSEFPGYNNVVNKETLADLKEADPEGFAVLAGSNANVYAKGKLAYKLIKASGVLPVEDTFVQDRLTAQKNAAKPRPLTSVSPQQGDSPMSRANAFANGLTPELQAQLRKEMEDARRAM